jgi:hypothetical protein
MAAGADRMSAGSPAVMPSHLTELPTTPSVGTAEQPLF